MIKNYARPTTVKIPETLKSIVLNTFTGGSEGPMTVTYPMYATGFPLLLHAAYGLPKISVNSKESMVEERLNLAGQIYNADIFLSYENSVVEATGLVFHPMAPYYLFGINAKAIINHWVPLNKIYGKLHPAIEEITNITNVENRVSLMLEFIEDVYKERKEPLVWLERAITDIINANGNIEIQEIIEKVKVSDRHFRRVFKEIVGMPPKHFCKVLQINTIFQMMEQKNEGLLNLALECGYFDQSHFISDFKKYIGETPTNFLKSNHSFIKSYLAIR